MTVPTVFPALAALATGIPYVLDVHNALLQTSWSKLPLTGWVSRRATALIAHNVEIGRVVKRRFPEAGVFVVADPVRPIDGASFQRSGYVFICSFGSDEPVSLILEVVKQHPELSFTITGDPRKLLPELRQQLRSCKNVSLPGFLPTTNYHSLLRSSKAAIVLTTRESVQPSGACEALSSDTPLIVTRTDLTELLFGKWAVLAENCAESLKAAILRINDQTLDLESYRATWNQEVGRGITELDFFLTGRLDAKHGQSGPTPRHDS